MHRSLGLLFLVGLALAGCAPNDTGIAAGEPRLREAPSILDFGEVGVGATANLTWTIHNDGIGDLEVAAAVADGGAISLTSAPPVVGPGAAADLVLAYAPSAEGPAEATLTMATNDPDVAAVDIPVRGLGVRPDLEISPRTLWFGTVPAGASATHTATLTSTGSGTVTVTDLVFPGDEALAYSWALPDGLSLPLDLPPGHATTLTVTYAPADEIGVSGRLVVASTDLDAPEQALRLWGEEADGEPPAIDILTPVWGSAWLHDEAVELSAVAVDPDDPPEDLTVLVYLDGSLVHTASPDATGAVRTNLGALPIGAHTLVARAIDPDGQIDEDEVELDVQDADEPLRYRISGGSSVFQYLTVDDDLVVHVDGTVAFSDTDGHQSSHAPFEVVARLGSELRVIATDANPCRKAVTDLVLHFGTARSQTLVTATSASSCPADADYDPAYAGPWPNDFVDATVEVAVP